VVECSGGKRELEGGERRGREEETKELILAG